MLNKFNKLEDLKKLNIEELETLCDDIRGEIIQKVAKTGGHIASSLGVVELSVALHYVFNSPKDVIIWDVGHQAYAHKLLTGRDLTNLRKKGGVSGFPRPCESPHDHFIAGHAGVSISQAVAIAKTNPNINAIAVIGDGSMTAGMAYEALNHAGALNLKNLIVILNDNEMSISKNVGAISNFLTKNIINSQYYQKVRQEVKNLVCKFPIKTAFNIEIKELLKNLRHSALNLIAPDSFFEVFGFRYVGPVDGNDLEVLIKTLQHLPGVSDEAPILFHIVTKKGKGFSHAEENPSQFHGIGAFDPDTGELCEASGSKTCQTFTSVFGHTMFELAKSEKDLVAITAAMKEGTGLAVFSKKYPERFFDVGIAEQHAVTFGAGLAKGGKKPVVAIYSSFMQRSLDQIIHDVVLNNLHVVCCMDRAGLVGEDGPTHHGVFDISYLRNIPNITFMAPSNASELALMLTSAVKDYSTPVFIRYPRGTVPSDWEPEIVKNNKIVTGKSRVVFSKNVDKKYISIFAIGYSVYTALKAIQTLNTEGAFEQIGIKLYDSRFIKPIDEEAVFEESKKASSIITVEENVKAGGFGSLVLETIIKKNGTILNPFKIIGIDDKFIEHASLSELRELTKIDTAAVIAEVKECLKNIK